MIEFFREHNACYTVFIQGRRTALMIAVEKVDLTLLQMLLQAGADTTLRDKVS